MGEVRAFSEEHAEGVARLYLRAIRGRKRAPGDELPRYFIDLFLRNPWRSAEMPALIYLDKGAIVGALGVLPRTMESNRRPIVLATLSPFMVDPEYHGEPVGSRLLEKAFNGPQDLSWTDGASGSVKAGWTALGGYAADLYAFNWIRILRPFATARIGLNRIGRIGRLLKPPSALAAVTLDSIVTGLPKIPLRPPASLYRSKPVSADEMLDCIHELGWRESLKPVYSSSPFQWLMQQAAAVKSGQLRLVTAANPENVRSGWFIYYVVRGGASFVLQIGVRRRHDFKHTLSALIRDAWEQGSACVKGASIPPYLTALTEQHCFFRHPHDRVLIHSRNPEIVSAVRTGEAALTRLEGAGWYRFAGENWE